MLVNRKEKKKTKMFCDCQKQIFRAQHASLNRNIQQATQAHVSRAHLGAHVCCRFTVDNSWCWRGLCQVGGRE